MSSSAGNMNSHPRQDFISAMQELSTQFTETRSDVLAREKIFKKAWKELSKSLSETVASDRLVEGNPLVEAAHDANKKVSAKLNVWTNAVNKYECNTEFRKDFGDSLLVFVYGKVKGGKSSLGNYIAYGHIDPDNELICNAQDSNISPKFFMRAAAGREDAANKEKALLERKKFAVGSMETTSEIQGFRLPGLTWVDSPGLHSVTEENGDLSKDYAKAADLIVYPMHSGQPGRASDLKEISGLFEAGKPFVVIVSRCDEVDVDIVNGEKIKRRIMKSSKDRGHQVEYVQKELIEKEKEASRKLLDPEVITLSVLYAQEHADDPTMVIESGMADFLNKMKSLAQSEGVSLKKAAPLKNLQAFIDRVVNGEESAQSLKDELSGLDRSIAEQRKSWKMKKKSVIGRAVTELGSAIDEAVAKHSSSRDSAALSKKCSKIIEEIVVRHSEEVMEEVLRDAENMVNDSIHFEKIKGAPEFRDLTENIRISDKKKKKAIFGTVAAVVTGLVGIALAAPTAGASLALTAEAIGTGVAISVATTAANYAGGKVGEAMASDNVISVKVGDNTHEVRSELNRIARDIAEKSIDVLFDKMDKEVLLPIEIRSKNITAAIDHFVSILTKEVRPNEV